MAQPEGTLAERLTLIEAVDHLLNRGVVLTGHTTISLAGVDLVYLGLNLLVASVETLRQEGSVPPRGAPLAATGPASSAPGRSGEASAAAPLRPSGSGWYAGPQGPGLAASPDDAPAALPLAGLPERLAGDPEERPERGLARLVLALVELLRQLLERQALRRMEGEGLTEDEVERMGLALMELEAKMAELRAVFDLGEDDLNLDLGPLGQLLR